MIFIFFFSISGGELFERVVADDFTLTERDSILFMRQICQGVEYMHQNKIVHLDLKVRFSRIIIVSLICELNDVFVSFYSQKI